MPRMNVLLAALAAAVVLPATSVTAADGDDVPEVLRSRGEQTRAERAEQPIRQRSARTGDEKETRDTDEEAGGRHAVEAGASARRDGAGELVELHGDHPLFRHQALSPYRRGFDRDGDGRLDEAETARMEAELGGYHDRLRAAVDGGRDGRLDERDWERFLRELHGEDAEAHLAIERRWLERVRARFDADGDGRLTAEEADRFAAAGDAHRVARLEAMDKDGDGRLGERELAFAGARDGSRLVVVSGLKRHVVSRRRTIGFGGTPTADTRTARATDHRD